MKKDSLRQRIWQILADKPSSISVMSSIIAILGGLLVGF